MIHSLAQLLKIMQSYGAVRFYAKKLAPNDNSKNQVYLGGDFSALNIIPHGEIYLDDREIAGSKQARPKAKVEFSWIDETGKYHAPDAQLILYPDYPEVRMSGFLNGCKKAPSEIMRVRDPGRVLFLGITPTGEVLGYATTAEDPLTRELNSRTGLECIGVFIEIPPDADPQLDSRTQLLQELLRIHEKQWIDSKKMNKDRTTSPYKARNGGGYTLEAELGIYPNGNAEPDFMGWEVKQYGVNNFIKYRPKSPVTLMTPEPTGGFYKDDGLEKFISKFGYADKSGKANRFNFGGVYGCNKDFHKGTNLRLILIGYDATKNKITDINGGILLLSRKEELAASWNFSGMMQHWNRKHAQAAYVPSIAQGTPPQYSYGSKILLCEQTDFLLFLKAVAAGTVYYDPAIKIENGAGKPEVKRRSQFRVRHKQLTELYHRQEIVDLDSQ